MGRDVSSTSERRVVPMGTARLESEDRKSAASAFRAPPPRSPRHGDAPVSLRPLKEFVQRLSPDHPLRVVLMDEPDEIDRAEYCVKLTVWLRLLPNQDH